MHPEDLDAVVAIDRFVSHTDRRQYYARKIESMRNDPHNINSSLVAELDGRIVGFVMGDVYFGEFGIPGTSATIDSIGVAPAFQNCGIAHDLMDQFLINMNGVGVRTLYTLVNWDDAKLKKFFARYKLLPSRRVNLEFQLS